MRIKKEQNHVIGKNEDYIFHLQEWYEDKMKKRAFLSHRQELLSQPYC